MSDTKGRLEISGSGIAAISHFALEAQKPIHQAAIAFLAKARWLRADIHAAADPFENTLELTA